MNCRISFGTQRSPLEPDLSAHLGQSHQEKQGTPTMGGLMILAGILAAFGLSGHWSLFGLTAGFALIGFADDYLVPKLRSGSRGLRWVPNAIQKRPIESFK